MNYHRPVLVDLSGRSEKGYGEEYCRTGSGQELSCITGPIAVGECELGGTVGGTVE